ncbi:DUF4083 family protein [Metabacillus malikii]|uniref:DUF4083 domain-containing protein n=1 Tax=Metabacillus malikii TaxID=1504265 RepID=A0ABT9ZFY9_9BACI|nr:DUF4083 family protein [Metabacillus malikii]MDQ0231164.1 hypothetical protein [Metabacillus malikii]
MNFGDFIVQFLMYIIIFGLFAAVFFLVRSLVIKDPVNSSRVEEKLDRIIELLEKDRKE